MDDLVAHAWIVGQRDADDGFRAVGAPALVEDVGSDPSSVTSTVPGNEATNHSLSSRFNGPPSIIFCTHGLGLHLVGELSLAPDPAQASGSPRTRM